MSRQTENYKELFDKIAQHGSEVVEEVEVGWTKGRIITGERVLIVLEMLYQRAVHDKNYSAAKEYLDRMLGKAKESLTLTNGSDLISKLSDEELTDKITQIVKATREGAAGKSD
jgi:hypothetical protein